LRIERPAPRVLQLTRFHSFSCHLLEDDEGLTLIDTGLPGSAPGILRAVQASGRPLRRILLTHAHTDHCGSLDRLQSALGDVEIAASPRTALLLSGDRRPQPDDGGRSPRGQHATCVTKPSRLLGADERWAGFRAIATPGHAPGHVSYLHEETGYLFTGDAVHSAGGRLAVSGEFRPLFPFPYFATWDRPLALASAIGLRALRPTALFPAHGSFVPDPLPALDEAIAHATKAFGQFAATRGPRPAARSIEPDSGRR
jgi:glyoxylase-like metal-dependent hydrolase (beta-lactamase superfamily II)